MGRDETFARDFDRQTFVEVTYPEADAMTACVKGQQDLVDLIDWNSVEVLNQNAQRTYVNAVQKGYRDDSALFLESDCDEQILLKIPFTQFIKVHSLILQHGERDYAPSSIKLFVNRPNVGLDEADVLEGKPIALKYVLFQKVQSLTVFIESNFEDEDVTRLQRLQVFGTPVTTTNISKEAWEKACKT